MSAPHYPAHPSIPVKKTDCVHINILENQDKATQKADCRIDQIQFFRLEPVYNHSTYNRKNRCYNNRISILYLSFHYSILTKELFITLFL